MKNKNTKLQNATLLLQRRADCLRNLPLSNLQAFVQRARWIKQARPEQITPPERINGRNWRIWLIMAGRGWGKTRTGAEDIAAYVLWNRDVRVGVIAPTYADARDTCVEGESGLLRVIPPSCIDNRGWYEQVPAQLMRWNRVNGEVFGGLARRRAAEGRLWNRT